MTDPAGRRRPPRRTVRRARSGWRSGAVLPKVKVGLSGCWRVAGSIYSAYPIPQSRPDRVRSADILAAHSITRLVDGHGRHGIDARFTRRDINNRLTIHRACVQSHSHTADTDAGVDTVAILALRAAFIMALRDAKASPCVTPDEPHPLSERRQAPWRALTRRSERSRAVASAPAPWRARKLRDPRTSESMQGIAAILAPMTAQRSSAARSHASLIWELSADASVRRGARICSEIACMP